MFICQLLYNSKLGILFPISFLNIIFLFKTISHTIIGREIYKLYQIKEELEENGTKLQFTFYNNFSGISSFFLLILFLRLAQHFAIFFTITTKERKKRKKKWKIFHIIKNDDKKKQVECQCRNAFYYFCITKDDDVIERMCISHLMILKFISLNPF